VERYLPDLVPDLAPVVSPMIATARVIRRVHGAHVPIVFIGPCIGKKCEASSPHTADDGVAAVLTFRELRTLLADAKVTPDAVSPSDFDPPHAGAGAVFPISRGLLETARIADDLVSGDVVATDGRTTFVDALKEFADGTIDARLLEILACNGCIMGAGISRATPMFQRRSHVRAYVRDRLRQVDTEQWERDMARFADLDLSRSFTASDQRIREPDPATLAGILARLGKNRPEDELNCGACGYDTCREHAIAIHKGLAESEMCLPFSIDCLHRTVEELRVSNAQLASTQSALMQSEKLASMGQLAAGIAHEVNNPLGVVLMYAHLLLDECGTDNPLHEDLTLIVEQADRCKRIVAGLLHFARQNRVVREPTDVVALVESALRAIAIPGTVSLRVVHEMADSVAEIDRDQIQQVLTNLVTNALDAMPDGGTLSVATRGTVDSVGIEVADTGTGISAENMPRIFDPFFTTKQIGRGTGLGLAVSYGIVKMHRGDIRAESNSDPARGPTGTTFTLTLPRRDATER
jgi:signal transduction histidine kinase